MTKANSSEIIVSAFDTPRHHPNMAERRKGQPVLSNDEVARWETATLRVQHIAGSARLSKAEVSRRIGINNAKLNQWYDGEYPGDFITATDDVEKWINSVDAMADLQGTIPNAPTYVATPTAKEIEATLLFAQTMPEMVVITTGAGVGKTVACERFRNQSPHVHLVTMRPNTKNVFGMLSEIGRTVGVRRTNSADYDRAIGERLQRIGNKPLLIIDEAQNLTDEAVDELRFFLDQYKCGIALVGNDEIYTRFHAQTGPSYAQIKRRIGKRLKRMKPLAGDVSALIQAWGIEDDDQIKILTMIGSKPGALGQISKTLQLAGMYAAGGGRAITAADIQSAYQNRSVDA